MPFDYKIRNYNLSLPDGHRLPEIKSAVPSYDAMYDSIVKTIAAANSGFIVDIGANVGDTAAIFRSCCNNPIICVEASDNYFEYLEKNVAIIGTDIYTVNKFLLTEDLLSLNIHFSEGRGSGGLVVSHDPPSAILSKNISLSDLCKQHGLNSNNIALFKTDTDGADAYIISEFLKMDFFNTVVFFECDLYATLGERLGKVIWNSNFYTMLQRDYSFVVFDNHGYPMMALAPEEGYLIGSLMQYIATQFEMGFVHTHYLDVWAFPPAANDIFVAIKSRFSSGQFNWT